MEAAASYNPTRTDTWPAIYQNCTDMKSAIQSALIENILSQTMGFFLSTANDDDQKLDFFRLALTMIFDPDALLMKSVSAYVLDIRKTILRDFSDDLKAEIEAEIAADVIVYLELMTKPREAICSESGKSWRICKLELKPIFTDDSILRHYGFQGPESFILGLFLMTSRYHQDWGNTPAQPQQPSEQTYFLASLMSACLGCSEQGASSKPPLRSPYAPLFSLRLPIELKDKTVAHGLLHSSGVVYLRMNELPEDAEDLFFGSTHLCQLQTPEVCVNHDTRRAQDFAVETIPTTPLDTEDPTDKK